MSDVKYFDLTIPAPRRLSMMRADFAAHAAKYPHCPEYSKPDSWRKVRGWGLHNWQSAFCTFSAGGAGQWVTHQGPMFRREKWVDELYPRNHRHTGWFADADAGETARGFIVALPHGRFIPGYEWSSNGERVYSGDVCTDEVQAARAADYLAERFAESACEDSERFNAMIDAETESENAIQEFCTLWPARGVSETLRGRVRDALQVIRDARETLRDATAAYEGA